MRPRHVLLGCAALSAAIALYALLSEDGYGRTRDLADESRALEGQVSAAEARNVQLAHEAERLQGDTPASEAHIERVAREELGLIGKDEVLVLTDDDTKSDKKSDSKNDAPAPAPKATGAPAP